MDLPKAEGSSPLLLALFLVQAVDFLSSEEVYKEKNFRWLKVVGIIS